jgi:hypothetical protein
MDHLTRPKWIPGFQVNRLVCRLRRAGEIAFVLKFRLVPIRTPNVPQAGTRANHARSFEVPARGFEWIVGNPSRGRGNSRCRLNSELVVHGGSDALCAAEVDAPWLVRDMAEEKLKLLQFASRGPTKASACPTQVVWCESFVADSRDEFFYHVPNELLGHFVSPGLAGATHLSEELSCLNACRYHPSRSIVRNPIGRRIVRMWPPFPTRSTIA